MELVFALITYLGMQKVDTSYFISIERCRYFAARINENRDEQGKLLQLKSFLQQKRASLPIMF